MSEHRLKPLLKPRSIAVLGASRKIGSVGNEILINLARGGYLGKLYPVNPSYEYVNDVTCYPTLASLPDTPEHVILAVADRRLEDAIDEIISIGVKACSIFSSLVLRDDFKPPLKDRLKLKIKNSGLLVAGPNCLGFFNVRDHVLAGAFDTRDHFAPGNVSLISQSGAGMQGIVDCEQRLQFNLAVSTGYEFSVTMEDYLEYALDLPETAAVGLFLETSREPEKFLAALAKAQERKIPIVVVKVGRSSFAAELAVSHSGALTGSDKCYSAVFEAFGVQRVEDMDQLATALIMFAQPKPMQLGGLVCLHDSGGERQLLVDLAERYHVPIAKLSKVTEGKLKPNLHPGLPAVNPLDAWAGGPGADEKMSACFTALLEDESAALGAVVHDRGPDSLVYPNYVAYLNEAQAATGKPVFLVANRQGSGSDQLAIDSTHKGLPVIDGVSQFLVGTKCLLRFRDFHRRKIAVPAELKSELVLDWRQRLTKEFDVNEALAGQLLTDFGIPMNPSKLVSDEQSLLVAAKMFEYPMVLKTATPGIKHKSECGGVFLNIDSEEVLKEAYKILSRRLGMSAILSPMVNAYGVEMILGMMNDSQFGPFVVVGFGGIYAEALNDTYALFPPFDSDTVARALDCLSMRSLLAGLRGKPSVNMQSYCETAARFSVFVAEFASSIGEIDINPILVTENGCLGLDALVVLKNTASIGEISGGKG